MDVINPPENDIIYTQSDEHMDKMLAERYQQELKDALAAEKKLKNRYRKMLAGLINVAGLYKWLDNENDGWLPVGIFQAEVSGKETIRITNNHDLNAEAGKEYSMVQIRDIRTITHYYCWQQSLGIEGDSFSGFMLFPLRNGRFFKVQYHC